MFEKIKSRRFTYRQIVNHDQKLLGDVERMMRQIYDHQEIDQAQAKLIPVQILQSFGGPEPMQNYQKAVQQVGFKFYFIGRRHSESDAFLQKTQKLEGQRRQPLPHRAQKLRRAFLRTAKQAKHEAGPEERGLGLLRHAELRLQAGNVGVGPSLREGA